MVVYVFFFRENAESFSVVENFVAERTHAHFIHGISEVMAILIIWADECSDVEFPCVQKRLGIPGIPIGNSGNSHWEFPEFRELA